MDEGVKALLSHSIRGAIYDIRPNPDKARVKPYMYWNPKKSKACVKMLLKRVPALQVLADKYPKGAFARMYADYVRQIQIMSVPCRKDDLGSFSLIPIRISL